MTEVPESVDVEQMAVMAHRLLSRLAVVQAAISRVDRTATCDHATEIMLGRSRAALSDVQGALEDLSRGLPPLPAALYGDVTGSPDAGAPGRRHV